MSVCFCISNAKWLDYNMTCERVESMISGSYYMTGESSLTCCRDRERCFPPVKSVNNTDNVFYIESSVIAILC